MSSTGVTIEAGPLILRRYRQGDVDGLLAIANNPNVSRNLTDRFPQPYTRADAENWVRRCVESAPPATSFAIDLEGTLIGGVGFERLEDVHSLSAEIGYWLGEPFWGHGYATEALRAATNYAFREFDFVRLQSFVYEWNLPSMRVLEKCGYQREGILRKAINKGGRIGDATMFARLRDDPEM